MKAFKADRLWVVGLCTIVAVACVFRAGMIIYANRHAERFWWPDSERYLTAARNVAEGLGPVVSPFDRTGVDPAYPLLLSWCVRMAGEDSQRAAALARWMNLPMGLGVVLFSAYLGRLLFGEVAGLAAAALVAVHPVQVYFHGLVLTEVTYTCLLTGALYAVGRYWLAGSGFDLFFAGLGLGLATLTRSSGLLFPLFVLPLILLGGWRQKPQTPGWFAASAGPGGMISAAVVFVVCYAAVLVPAAYRKWRLVGDVVPVRTGSGASLLEAVGPWADGGPGFERIVWPEYPPGANELERDRINRAEAIRYIMQDPARFVRLAGVKFLRTWNIRMNEPRFRRWPYDVLAMAGSLPIYLLAAVGLWRHRRSVGRWYILLAPAIYISVLHMIFVGSVRYRYPAMPALMVLAAGALSRRMPAEMDGGRTGQAVAAT